MNPSVKTLGKHCNAQLESNAEGMPVRRVADWTCPNMERLQFLIHLTPQTSPTVWDQV